MPSLYGPQKERLPLLVMDWETTGLRYTEHSPVSVGAVDFRNPARTFYAECSVMEGREISDFALKVNGFTKEQLTNGSMQSAGDLVQKYYDWAGEIFPRIPAGENPLFDVRFDHEAADTYGIPQRTGRRTFDLHTIAISVMAMNGHEPGYDSQEKTGGSRQRLDSTLAYVGLQPEPSPHNALTGALLEAEAFSRLLYGENLFTEYKSFDVPEFLKG